MPGPGTPNLFKNELSRNLNRIFPPQIGGFELVQVLSGIVNLVHDFPGTLPYANYSLLDVQGTADVLSITQAIPVPEGYIQIIDEIDVWTDDTTPRDLMLHVHYRTGAGDLAINAAHVTSLAVPQHMAIGRRIILPPSAYLECSVPALTAGKKLRFTTMYLQVPAGQFCPKY